MNPKNKSILIIGEKINSLTILREIEPHTYFRPDRNCMERNRMIECLCICGNKTSIQLKHFKHGHTKSCGCLQSETIANIMTTHGLSANPIYSAYQSMMSRCYDKKDASYEHYGAKGVIVCDEWINSIESFYNWAIKNGWDKGLQLDKDINGTGYLYSPETCCWVTSKVNSNNKSNTIRVVYNSKNVTLSELSELIGVNYQRLYIRYKQGLPINDMIKPVKRYAS